MLLILAFTWGCQISGKVIDENGQGVEGINILLKGQEGTLTTTTNEEGAYAFYNLSFDTYMIQPEHEGLSFYPESKFAKAIMVPISSRLSPWILTNPNTTF